MKKLSILLLLSSLSLSIFAQQGATKPTIRLSGFIENFGLSAYRADSPIHLGGTIAIAFTGKHNGNYSVKNSIELGYFNHAPVFQTAYLAWKPSYEWQFNSGLQLHGIWGIGYAQSMPTQTTYVQEDGSYQKRSTLGKPGGLLAVGLGFGYQFAQQSAAPTTLFFRQELTIIAPFSIYKDLPLGINSMLSVGVILEPFH